MIAVSRTRSALGALLLVLLLGLVISIGYDGRRALQIWVLSIPVAALILWPLRSVALHRLRRVMVVAGTLCFAVDSAVRVYLKDAYGAGPDSAVVVGAFANSSVRESIEYLATSVMSMLGGVLAVVLVGLVAWLLSGQGVRVRGSLTRPVVWVLSLLLLVTAVSYVSKPWRRQHPLNYWAEWFTTAQQLRASWSNLDVIREAGHRKARDLKPTVAIEGPSTVVLVFSESINRDNMGLYGYGRDTTPKLARLQREMGSALTVLRNAWSVDASTLPSFTSMLTFGQNIETADAHALALARAAGYKVWWLSNHDDIGIEQLHGRYAETVEMINTSTGRSTASLDGALLPRFQAALNDPASRKLIVLHMLGAHPHYQLRFPSGANPYADVSDPVDAAMKAAGRSAWIRRTRAEYDAAIRYHDEVVAESLAMTRHAPGGDHHRAWMFLSDHGQEVGHESDRAGHSPMTASGYRIPVLLWRSRPAPSEAPPLAVQRAVAERPFRSDWMGWTLMDLLGVQWPGRQDRRNVLSDAYRWENPTLPITVVSFAEAPLPAVSLSEVPRAGTLLLD